MAAGAVTVVGVVVPGVATVGAAATAGVVVAQRWRARWSAGVAMARGDCGGWGGFDGRQGQVLSGLADVDVAVVAAVGLAGGCDGGGHDSGKPGRWGQCG